MGSFEFKDCLVVFVLFCTVVAIQTCAANANSFGYLPLKPWFDLCQSG
jgi:hypothetical protein